MNATGRKTHCIKRVALLAALLGCPHVSLAALAPTLAAESVMRQTDAPFMLAALPPAEATESEAGAAVFAPAVTAKKTQKRATSWARPQVKLGGRLLYFYNRDTSDYANSKTQGLMTSIVTSVIAPVWQPWLGSLNLDADFGVSRNETQTSANSFGASGDGVSESTYVNGNAQISMLPLSKFPFEAHMRRSDTRSASNLSSLDSYNSQNAGFSQQISPQKGLQGGKTGRVIFFGPGSQTEEPSQGIAPLRGGRR